MSSVTVRELVHIFGKWNYMSGLFRVIVKPEAVLDMFQLDGEIILRLMIEDNIWDVNAGSNPHMRLTRISTTPKGLPVWRLTVDGGLLVARGIAEPKWVQKVLDFIESIDELPPRDWEVQVPD